MKYIEIKTTDPHINLATEEYLLLTCEPEESYFLLWQNEPSIIIGKHQNTLEEINTEYVDKHGIHVVRRMSGGGAVYHDLGNLNYSFIIGNGKTDLFDFGKYAKPIVDLLVQQGVDAHISGRNDLLIGEKKFSGTAQYVKNHKLLHHGTLLYHSELEHLVEALNVSGEKIESKGIKSIRSRVTNIQEHMPDKLSLPEFWKLLSAYVSTQYEDWEPSSLTEEQLQGIQKLADEKYRTWDWKFGASPAFNYKTSKRFDGGKLEVLLEVKDGLIKDCKFYGDFFSGEDFPLLEEGLRGIRYEQDEVGKVLEGLRGRNLILGISPEQITEIMFD